MNRNAFKSMSTDELWTLHEEIANRLAAALTAEKNVLENRLKRLRRGIEIQPAANGAKPRDLKPRDLKSRDAKSARATKPSTARRPYPAVVPKYRNPDRPSETWAGRGKKPRWLAAQLKSGKRIDDFRIWHAA
jgi:DNA-binding protein H-NS